MNDVFLICSVRDATEELKKEMEDYVTLLESKGLSIYYPARDTNQTLSGIDICRNNAKAIADSKEIHIFYTSESQGTHFDMGAAFVLDKPLFIVKNVPLLDNGEKCYQRMLLEWQEQGPQLQTLTEGKGLWGNVNPMLGGKR